jgi:hypothetical protein
LKEGAAINQSLSTLARCMPQLTSGYKTGCKCGCQLLLLLLVVVVVVVVP